jgi:hypothetical protein
MLFQLSTTRVAVRCSFFLVENEKKNGYLVYSCHLEEIEKLYPEALSSAL